MLSTAFRLVQRFFPNAPQDRKPRHSTKYKPTALRSPLAHHSKRERSSRSSLSSSSDTDTSYASSSSSSSSASSASSDCGDTFECDMTDPKNFSRAEFIKLRIDSMEGIEQTEPPGMAALSRDPVVRDWLAEQRVRDEAAKKLYTTDLGGARFYTRGDVRCAARVLPTPRPDPYFPPAPVPAPTPALTPAQLFYGVGRAPPSCAIGRAPSFGIGRAPRREAVRKWHGLQKKAETFRADQQVYARVRGSPATRYAEYQERWAAALAPTSTPTLQFSDIPWPVLFAPIHPNHIAPDDVNQFLLPSQHEAMTREGQARLANELKRFHPDKFNVQVIPLVVPHQRAPVAQGAARILDILISSRDDIKRRKRAA